MPVGIMPTYSKFWQFRCVCPARSRLGHRRHGWFLVTLEVLAETKIMNFKLSEAADVRRLALFCATSIAALQLHSAELMVPGGYTALFNAKDLTGWYGLNADPRKIFSMSEQERAEFREKSMEDVRKHWTVQG